MYEGDALLDHINKIKTLDALVIMPMNELTIDYIIAHLMHKICKKKA